MVAHVYFSPLVPSELLLASEKQMLAAVTHFLKNGNYGASEYGRDLPVQRKSEIQKGPSLTLR